MDKINKKVTHKLVSDEDKVYVSEVQEFIEPVDYEEAFKQYYPKEFYE